MYDTGRDLLDALRATPDTLGGLLAGVTPEQASAARGGDEDWNVIEVLCHLRDAEESALARAIAMRDQDTPFLAAYDQDVWAVERDYAGQDLRATLDSFIGLRARYIAALSALAPADWQRQGRHEEQGEITIATHTLHIVAHDAIHAAQIARQLAQPPANPKAES